MARPSFKLYIFFLLFVISEFTIAQNNLIINDSLEAKSEKLKVKMGSQMMGKTWKFSFGNYAVTSSKNSIQKESTKTNNWLFPTKSETKSDAKFSFTLENKTTETANVNAIINRVTESKTKYNGLGIEKTVGEDDTSVYITQENQIAKDLTVFESLITTSGDTSAVWHLIFRFETTNTQAEHNETYLTDGKRKITIYPISSAKKGEQAQLPALGYEFVENGKALCALQYYGGGLFGMNKNIIWLDKTLTPRMSLILAAAMTSILQFKN
jgi:hypothetical protein